MAYSKGHARELQKAASDKYESKIHAVRLQIPVDAWPIVQQYSRARGLSVGACIKACLQECMQRDGYGMIATSIKQSKSSIVLRTCNDQSISTASNPMGDCMPQGQEGGQPGRAG